MHSRTRCRRPLGRLRNQPQAQCCLDCMQGCDVHGRECDGHPPLPRALAQGLEAPQRGVHSWASTNNGPHFGDRRQGPGSRIRWQVGLLSPRLRRPRRKRRLLGTPQGRRAGLRAQDSPGAALSRPCRKLGKEPSARGASAGCHTQVQGCRRPTLRKPHAGHAANAQPRHGTQGHGLLARRYSAYAQLRVLACRPRLCPEQLREWRNGPRSLAQPWPLSPHRRPYWGLRYQLYPRLTASCKVANLDGIQGRVPHSRSQSDADPSARMNRRWCRRCD